MIVFGQMSGEQEAQAVLHTEAAAATAEPAAGDALFVVSNRWFSEWCQYSGFCYDTARKKPRVVPQQQPGPRPGPIDNSDLLAQPLSAFDLTPEQQAGVATLRDKLVDKQHFWLLHEPTWNLLKEWYGCKGPEVRREYQMAGRRLQLDAHQQHFRVLARPAGGDEQETVVGISPMATLIELKAMACAALGLDPDDFDVYDFSGCQQGANLESSSYKTLTGCKLQDQQALLLLPRGQQAQASGAAAAAAGTPSSPVLMLPAPSPLLLSSPRGSGGFMATSPMSPLSRSFDRAPAWAEDVVFEAPGRGHGLAGLGNLGNTCFMNSSLQCLAHTPPLMSTFLTDAYRRFLNKDNPLSLGGKLALAFGALMEKVWRGGVSHVSPKLFKWQLAKFAPQFSGYSQQDSQELLAFLLDGLHEDLNRITDKPYIEDKDSDGRPDEEVAAEAWANYRRRNDSVIVDAFQGLYRSLLTCPNCNYHSVKFDPLMYLSLPLPSSKMRGITFTAVYVDGSALPRQYGIELPKSATVRQLYAGVAALLGLPAEAAEDVLLLTQFNLGDANFVLYTDKKVRISSIEDLRPRSLFQSRSSPHMYVAYVYPSAQQGPRGGGRPVHVYHRARGSRPEWPIPATPLFLPEEQLQGLSGEAAGGDYELAPGEGRDAIMTALGQLLRPFRKQQALEPAPAEVPANDTNSGGQRQQDAEVQADGAAPMEEVPLSAGQGAAAVESGSEEMEVEGLQGPGQGPQHFTANGTMGAAGAVVAGPAAGSDAPWLDSLAVCSAISATAGGDVPMAGASAETAAADWVARADGSNQPFDMWAAQREEAARAAAAAAAAAAARPPFLLKAAKPSGYGPGVTSYGVQLEMPQEGEPLLLLAEWQEAAGQLYDPRPLLQAEPHPSAAALAEKQRDGGKSVTLAECLETFLQPEQLDAEDSWYCGRCKAHVQADKKLDLWSLPEVLVVHLKRFSYSRYSRDKLDTLVDFPLTDLDMAPYLLSTKQRAQQAQQQKQGGDISSAAPSTRYDLYAVSNHYGGMGGGHYTAYCRLPGAGGGWHTFDDSHVSRMDEGGVKTAAAYVLFYRRQGCGPEECVEAMLQRHAAEQEQEQGQGLAAAAAHEEEAAGQQGVMAAVASGQHAHAALMAGSPMPSPLLFGGAVGSSLGKRQPPPEPIEEEGSEGEGEGAGEREADDDIPAAGAIDID